MHDLAAIAIRYQCLSLALDERGKRLFAAAEAKTLGYGGISALSRIVGLSRPTITAGIAELENANLLPPGRAGKAGGGRKAKRNQMPDLVEEIERLVEPDVRGDPESPLRWTLKSLRRITAALQERGFMVSRRIVADVLHGLNFSLQGNRKTKEGEDDSDRDAQFHHINDQAKAFLSEGEPVISVDTKKKELIGEYENKGREWHAKGSPVDVNGHDFPSPDVPRAHPYGVHDLARNKGFANVGTDHDTATFAVASIRRWWKLEGRRVYPKAKRLLITADGGGSNGSRLRLWKWELQRLADDLGIPVSACHFPRGTSEWNKIEHRLFSLIGINWRGKPLASHETAVNSISRTTTAKGLPVTCKLDKRRYNPGRKIKDEDMASLSILRSSFRGDLNYTPIPRP